jgi:uncharacterized protein YaaQ
LLYHPLVKLVMCVVHSRDRNRVTDELVRAGFKFTIMSSTGGFLREGNSTFLIGVEPEQIDPLLELIQQNCQTREQVVNVSPLEGASAGAFLTAPIKVPVGGAVVFVLPVERFERY